jgi:serine/threonine protein kinase
VLCCPVVAKFPRPHQVDHPRAAGSLGREVAALGGNLHPALPRLYEDGSSTALPYLEFEYVDGLALDEEIDQSGAFSAQEVALLGAQLLAGLRQVHARGLAHVDIKPENVVLREGRPVLLDFGSARRHGASQPSGKLIGSPGYAAPDLEAGAAISPAMDMYGLGAVLYEVHTGSPAFSPDVPAADRAVPEAVPDSALGDLIARLIAPDPAHRPDLNTAMRALGAIAAAAGQPAWPEWVTYPALPPRHPLRRGAAPEADAGAR